MGYRLQAVIATDRVLRKWAGPIREAHIVPLGQHLSVVPMTDELFDAITVAGAPHLDGLRTAPAGLGDALAACSVNGPVAYVEAEYFGGTGTQATQVWDGGKVVLGPLSLALGEPSPVAGSPISQGLRRLGAARDDRFDEFEAVGLDRHRNTEDWLPETSD